MGGYMNQLTGRGVGPTGAGRGADTGTAAAYRVRAVDIVEQDPVGAKGGGVPHHPRHPDWNQEGEEENKPSETVS